MINTYTSLYHNERTVLISCIKALAPLFEMDCTNDTAMDCVKNAIRLIEKYPEINDLKRMILKKPSPRYYVIQAEKKLSLCIAGEGTKNTLNEINEALHNALSSLSVF